MSSSDDGAEESFALPQLQEELESAYEQLDQRQTELTRAAEFGQRLLEAKARLQTEVEQLSGDLSSAQTSASALVAQLQRKVAEGEAEAHSMHSSITVKDDEIEDLRRRVMRFERAAAEQHERIASAVALDTDTLSAEVSELNERVAEMERSRAVLRVRLVDESAKRSECESELAAGIEARSLAKQATEAARREVERASARAAAALESARAAQSERDEMEVELRAGAARHARELQELRDDADRARFDEQRVEARRHSRDASMTSLTEDDSIAFDEELLLAMMEEEGGDEERGEVPSPSPGADATEGAAPAANAAPDAADTKAPAAPAPAAERVAAVRATCVAALQAWYGVKNPARVGGAERILAQYNGRERTLHERLKRKYGDAPGTFFILFCLLHFLSLTKTLFAHTSKYILLFAQFFCIAELLALASARAAKAREEGARRRGRAGSGRGSAAVSGGWLWTAESPPTARGSLFSPLQFFASRATPRPKWVRKFFFLTGEILYERDAAYDGPGLGRPHPLQGLQRVEVGLDPPDAKTAFAFGLVGLAFEATTAEAGGSTAGAKKWVLCCDSLAELSKWHGAFAALSKRRRWAAKDRAAQGAGGASPGRGRSESTVDSLKREIIDELERKNFQDDDLAYFLRLSLALKLELAVANPELAVRLSDLDTTAMYAGEFLLFTVTFYANLAHSCLAPPDISLTISPRRRCTQRQRRWAWSSIGGTCTSVKCTSTRATRRSSSL